MVSVYGSDQDAVIRIHQEIYDGQAAEQPTVAGVVIPQSQKRAHGQ